MKHDQWCLVFPLLQEICFKSVDQSIKFTPRSCEITPSNEFTFLPGANGGSGRKKVGWLTIAMDIPFPTIFSQSHVSFEPKKSYRYED
jgi:hypothetical protein